MVGRGEAIRFVEWPASPLPPEAPIRFERSGYGERSRPNWAVIAAIAVFHIVALIALIKFDVISIARPKPQLLVVNLMAEPPVPAVAAPKPETRVVTRVEPTIVTPAPIVALSAPLPATVVTTPVQAPKAVVIAAPVAAAPAPTRAVDLDENRISGNPPKYPIESLRRKEQGTVLLHLTVGADGSVTDIAIARSSGFERLDNAALRAVRGWRWRPMTRGGQAVAVTGDMPIPFTLNA
jgi:protein TonB